MTELNIVDERREQNRRSEDAPPPTLASRYLGIAFIVVGLITTIFTAGYNWKSVTEIRENQDQFVRKDVQQEQLRNVNEKLFDISHQLELVQTELKSQRR